MTLLQDWVTDQAERRPEAPAVVSQGDELSYGRLESNSNQLARLLQDAGCRKGDMVCFLMPKSSVAIWTILGILKADCIYVPLDPASPAPRLRRMLESCRPRYILAMGSAAELLNELVSAERPTFAGRFASAAISTQERFQIGWLQSGDVPDVGLEVRFTLDDLKGYPTTRPDYENSPDDPAYILFTSGSTGAPKGVVITHSNVRHFVEWANAYFTLVSSDRVSGHSPLHFDLSTYDIFGTLAAGARLYLVPPEANLLPHKLAEFIRGAELTQWFSVPSILSYMARFDVVAPGGFPALKRLLWCGDVFPTSGLIYWMERLPHVAFTNLYGPTEATIASSYYTVPQCPSDVLAKVPIGRPCSGEDLLVLDENLDPVSAGEIGDLYIRGAGLSPGYWEDPQRTRAAFLYLSRDTDPGAGSGAASGDRIYKTGDLASIAEDGLVYFHGRADSQIKSRGYRIELGEIETALGTLTCLEDCAVVAITTSGFEGTTICCAYVPLAGARVTPAGLKRELGKVLPRYMLPARWMAFKQLPLNANGKVDRKAIREQFRA